MANEHMGHLNRDLIGEILSRVDGETLAAASCACSDLRGIAQEERLWEDLCHATWPSTQGKRTHDLISSLGGFTKFFADSYPLLVYKKDPQVLTGSPHVSSSPSDFVSLVDVYYKKKCIFSKVLHGIPATNDAYYDGDGGGGDENHDVWFLNCPFRLDVLNYQNGSTTLNDDGYDAGHDATMGTIPSVPLAEKKRRGSGKLCRKLEENVRLSWVLLNTKSGKAVNLSSWKPVLVQRHWPSEGDFVMRFGCAIPVEEWLLPCKSAECVISMRCRLLEREGCLRWTEISMQVENMEGAHVNGRTSIMVLERVLRCQRSRHNWEVEKGYEEHIREKGEVMQKKMRNEGFADRLCLFSGIALSASLCLFVFS